MCKQNQDSLETTEIMYHKQKQKRTGFQGETKVNPNIHNIVKCKILIFIQGFY